MIDNASDHHDNAQMKRIEIDQDVYDYILKNAVEIGESASSILRRLFGVRGAPSVAAPSEMLVRTAIQSHLQSTEFKYAIGVVGKFLSVLGAVYREHSAEFDQIEQIRGRGRLYFSREVDAITQAGKSVNPKQIPGSPFWAITNTSTRLKQELLEQIMLVFNYSSNDIQSVTTAIAE